MKTLVSTLALLLLAVLADAASFFLTQPGGGSFNGADWNNAWSDITGVNWGSVGPGDTIYVAGGTYSHTLHVQGNGTALAAITIKRATASDSAATGAAGWSSAFDSQVVLSGFGYYGIDFDAGTGIPQTNIVVDGRVDSGISVQIPDLDNGAGVVLSNATVGVTFANIEIVGPGSPNTSGYPFTGDVRGFQVYGPGGSSRNTTLTHCRIHGVVDAIYAIGSTALLVDHCQIYDIWALGGAGQHDNILINYGTTNCTFRYNTLWNWATEGIGFFGYATNWWIYGNAWHDPSGASGSQSGRVIESQVFANGPIYFFNNTVANGWLIANTANDGAWASGVCVATNNLVWNCTASTVGLPLEDYTFSSGAATGAHSISSGSYPFSHAQGAWPYVSTNDLHILGTVGASYPAGKGFSLGAPYNTDLDGNAQPALWLIGAFVAPAPGTSINGGRINGAVILH